jgi:diaminopimelate epimerase
MKLLSFTKMVGTGNDFIVIDNRTGVVGKDPVSAAKQLCDRKFGIGADGLLLLEKSTKAEIRMRIFNPDGSEASMCGNGIRCIARFAVDNNITGPQFQIETLAGLIGAEVRGDIVKAKMLDPKDLKLKLQVPMAKGKQELHFVDTGVPHTVVILDALKEVDVKETGRFIRNHKMFAPKGTNVNFISFRPGNSIEVRTYERGVEDETLSCGTGTTASALIAASLKSLKSPVQVLTQSGETLKVYFTKQDGGFEEVYLEGPVKTVFEGRVQL